MITESKRFTVNKDRYVSNYFGLSTDTKPSGKINGSMYHEVDTGKIYMYDEDNDNWYEHQSGSGGGVQSEFIHAESHTMIDTYAVPVLTDEQITKAYNGIMAGNNVFIVDDLDFITIQVLDASSIDDISVRILFTDKMVLTYKLGGDIVHAPIGGGGNDFIINANYRTGEADKTYSEVKEAFFAGKNVSMYAQYNNDVYFLRATYYSKTYDRIMFITFTNATDSRIDMAKGFYGSQTGGKVSFEDISFRK